MLPEDAKHRRDLAREQAIATSTLSRQASLDGHLVPKEQVIHYTEVNFRTVLITKWIIETDQVSSPKLLHNPVLMMQFHSHSKRFNIRLSKVWLTWPLVLQMVSLYPVPKPLGKPSSTSS